MAQTALAFNSYEVVGYTMGLTKKEVEKTVKQMLKEARLLPGRIRAAENAATGKGLTIIKGARLTKREEELTTVARAYTVGMRDNMHVAKAENLFAGIRGDDEEDAAALDELTGLMVGTRPFGGEAVVWNGIVMYQEEAMAAAARDAESMRNELEWIEWALADLEAVDAKGAMILRMQYKQCRKVNKVMMALTELLQAEDEQIVVSEATYHRWRKEAMEKFGKLVGL